MRNKSYFTKSMDKMKINKIIAVFLIILLGAETVFAATNTTQTSFMWETFYWILNLLNLIWIPFAILAWKIFSNDFVYWTFMNMDKILWEIWNFSKNASLIILWFIFIVLIFSLFIWKTKDIGKNLAKLVLAWVLIPLSWFIIWSLVSLSTILLVAVWSFPFKVVNVDISSIPIGYCKRIELSPTLGPNISKDIVDCKWKWWNINNFIKEMNDLSWPLLYIWQAILYLDSNWWILDENQLKKSNENLVKAVSIWFVLKLIVLLLFVIPIIWLIIIWLIRIFWLWIYIWFSPFIILDQIFWWKFLWQKNEFKFSQMIWLIFQPVVIVFVMWVVLIFLASLRSIMIVDYSQNKVSNWLVKLWVCKDNINSFCIENKPVFEVQWNLLKDFVQSVWWFFGYLIFLILVTIILGALIKIASKTTEITSSVVENLYKFSKDSIMAVPIIPTWRWWVSLGALNLAMKQNVLTKWFESKAAEASDRLVKKIYAAFGIESTDISISELHTIKNDVVSIRTPEDIVKSFVGFLHKTQKEYPNLVIATSPNFKEAVYEYLKRILELDGTAQWIFEKLQIFNKDKGLLSVDKVFTSNSFLSFLGSAFTLKSKTFVNFSALYSAINKDFSPEYIYKPLKDLDKK